MNVELKILEILDVTPKYVSWLNDYEVVKYTEQRHQRHTLETVKEFVINKLNSDDDFYGIYYNKRHVGNIRIGPLSQRYKIASIGYFIGDRRYWGKGIATKSISMILKLAKNKYKLSKVTAELYAPNIASEKALIKNGFVLEGILKNNAIFEGNRINSKIFGRLI
tara:strand:+ start:1883 stop:2377 length:495 start_codon:yes stop_codon:yes gene_type:complete